MLKCPMPGCGVVIAPERGIEDVAQQKGALMRHLTGEESSWWKCCGHGLEPAAASKIAKVVGELAVVLDEVLQARRSV